MNLCGDVGGMGGGSGGWLKTVTVFRRRPLVLDSDLQCFIPHSGWCLKLGWGLVGKY